MSDIQAAILSAIAIGIALAWNPIVAAVKSSLAARAPVPPAAGFSTALDALAVVRNRLVSTGCLDEPAKAAIEAVTHALIAGTDK